MSVLYQGVGITVLVGDGGMDPPPVRGGAPLNAAGAATGPPMDKGDWTTLAAA